MPATRPGAKGAVISGWGTALPEKVITNHELSESMDTSHDWIFSRTGINERRIGGSTIGLSIESGRQALEMAGLDPSPAWFCRRRRRTGSGATLPPCNTSSACGAGRSTSTPPALDSCTGS
jgi:hypothetical protein